MTTTTITSTTTDANTNVKANVSSLNVTLDTKPRQNLMVLAACSKHFDLCLAVCYYYVNIIPLLFIVSYIH